jgi:hypothetical protein
MALGRLAGKLIAGGGDGNRSLLLFPCYDNPGFLHFMGLYLLTLGVVGVALESVILARALVVRWYGKCPFFFCYLASVLVQNVFVVAVYFFKFKYYSPVYWCTEFFSLLMGCGVTWEIFRLILGRYPGAGRVARNVLAFVLIMALSKGLVGTWHSNVSWGFALLELERDLRAIQALSLIVLATLVAYYHVPLGRYAKGIFAGYGTFIATMVLALTLRASIGPAFQNAWVVVQPLTYATALGIWCVSLWAEEGSAVEESQPKIEEHYRSVALLTRKGLLQAREFLGKAARP